MANSLSPGFVKVEYHSAYAPHVHILPVNTPVLNSLVPADSEITAWDTSLINWRTMTTALVTEFVPRFPSTVTYDRATLFSQPTPDDDPVPWDSYAIGLDGTNATAGWRKATEETVIARDTEFSLAKLVFLDFDSQNDFDAQIDPTTAGLDDILAEWFAVTNGWASRNGARPNVFIKATRKLNDTLRKEYRMT